MKRRFFTTGLFVLIIALLPLLFTCQSNKEFSKLETTVLTATGEIVFNKYRRVEK
jgi:uncharacterized membrane protein YbhN (UPF0104 family)